MKQRELKFRAWDGKRMYEPCIWIGQEYLPASDSFRDIEDGLIMQFTGLLDKNGKEIYEGDIVIGNTFKSNPCAVTFENGSFIWHKEPLSWDLENEPPELCLPERWAQVIGNVFENPDLLTQ